MTIKEKKEKRAGLVNQMRALLNTATAELTAEQQQQYDSLEKDVDRLGSEIEREERLEKIENNLRGQRDSNYHAAVDAKNAPRAKVRASDAYRDAFFNGFIRRGKNNMGPEFLNILTEGSDTDGGYLVPLPTEEAIIKKIYEQNPIRELADVKTSALDVAIPVRTGIPTFGWIAEGGTYGKASSTYGKLVMNAHKYGGIIPISDELLQDASENMEAEINDVAGLAFGELESDGFLTGNAVGKPEGLFVPAAVSGTTVGEVETAANNAITSDELIDTFHKLEPQYRANATWVLRDATVKLIRKLKNATTGDYMWQPGLQMGQPDMMLGRPVRVCKGAPAVAASTRVICFGNIKAYRIRDRLGISVKPLNELYAEAGQVGFRFTRRTDAKLCDGNAVVFLKMHA